MFFVIQPDMAQIEDEGISDEISRLEEKSQGQVFGTFFIFLGKFYQVFETVRLPLYTGSVLGIPQYLSEIT